jgi:hypothetical protein
MFGAAMGLVAASFLVDRSRELHLQRSMPLRSGRQPEAGFPPAGSSLHYVDFFTANNAARLAEQPACATERALREFLFARVRYHAEPQRRRHSHANQA